METQRLPPEHRLLAGLGYPLAIIPSIVLLTDLKRSHFLRFHAVQALVLGASAAVIGGALGALLVLPMMFFRPLWPLALGVPLLLVGAVLLTYLCGYRAYRGQVFVIPLVAGLTGRFVELPRRIERTR